MPDRGLESKLAVPAREHLESSQELAVPVVMIGGRLRPDQGSGDIAEIMLKRPGFRRKRPVPWSGNRLILVN